MKRVALQPAYVLHRRAYRETSFLVELFSKEEGRVTVLAKGARQARASMQGSLQPFSPLLVSFAGRGELMTLSQAEPNGQVVSLQGDCLFAGLYLNELLVCLLQKWDPHPGLYMAYIQAITGLHQHGLEQKILRAFEKRLLEELGYGPLPRLAQAGQVFDEDKYYRFVPEQGFVLCGPVSESGPASDWFLGKSLMAIAEENWEEGHCLSDAKRLARFLLAPLLGARPIYSRQLFIPF